MWPLILLGLGGAGYYFYKKSSTTTPAVSPYHAAILSLPAAGGSTPQNTAVYTPPTSPVVQTSNGPSSGIPQYPSPSSAPHAPINTSLVPLMHTSVFAPQAPTPIMHTAVPVATYKLPNPDAPQGVTNIHGDFVSWAPYDAGTISNDPTTGNWLASNQPDTISLVVTTPQGSITLPRTMIYNIDTGEIRI
jgi:hypothetical protein